jgi:ribosomal protein S18 acetylase RimI-like enzyme
MTKVRVEGEWPGQVVLRRGWARAEARPWNDATPMAHLRLVRGGGPSFIGESVEALADLGVDAVLSPPLPASAQTAWKEAGFAVCCDLTLMRRSLDRVPPPGHLVMTGSESDIPETLRIDAAAFEEFWRFDRWALDEAMEATASSIIHVVRSAEGGLAGFAVTGAGNTISYLQRLAVDPRWQGQGIGRSLVRASARWAKRAGSRALMLNTQTDNEGAIGLYRTEGFELLSDPLAVLSSAA